MKLAILLTAMAIHSPAPTAPTKAGVAPPPRSAIVKMIPPVKPEVVVCVMQGPDRLPVRK